uniref:Protocadherin gamma subfamily C, 5 n=1 Tax=Laticauda laticaudata TaxID=8630 RepID=A0A8C5SY46_LATLA
MEPQLSWQLSCKWQVLGLFLLFNWVLITGQIRYSVVEESKLGTMVGEVAHDLGLTLADLSSRRLWLGSEESKRYFAINLDSGTLMVNEKIDRETLCGASSLCILPVQVVIENPLELFHLEVEILDLNDNSPNFITPWLVLRVAESAAGGSRLPLESAHDADVGTNAVSAYQLSPNPHFILDIKNVKDGKLLPELVLDQPLDREKQSEHQLILTAYDGGDPVLSGTSRLTIVVLDNNDNEPTFDLPVYKIHFLENIPVGSLIFKLNATDPDADSNGEIQYSFGIHTSDSIQTLFGLDPHTGEIYIQGIVDFEESQFYELHIRARDKGIPQMEGHCVIQIEVEDENDHFPDILLTSLVNPLPENIPLETVVGLFSVRDQDSGVNGKVSLQIPMSLPFKIKSFENHFSLITHERLDRETVSQYIIKLTAQDSGIPPLSRDLTILLNISDINDNAPSFSQHLYNSFLKENDPPGSLLCTVSASDPDEGDNSRLTYSVAGNQVQDAHISSFIYINPDNGNIYAKHSFDYEILQVLQILVIVQDAGTPILSSSVTVFLFILDQNDNAPVVLYPVTGQQLSALQRIPLLAPVGYVITKVTAVDADSGHNAWLSYSLLPQSTNVSATDADKDQNSQLSYIVLSSPGQELIEDLTSFISINPTNGEVFAESSFDYECNNHFQFQVEACDGGSPSLCNRVMVHVYLLDQNDNAPKVQFPFTEKDSVVQFRIPRSTMAKALITKIIAVDLDSGQNAWLSYHLKQATDLTLFSISLHSGEMRTLRIIQDLDDPTQELVIVVKDSGELSMSTSVTVIIFLEESTSEVFLGLSARSVESERPPTLTLYLIICLAAISTIMLIALVALGLSPGDAMIGVQVATSGPPVRGYRSCFSPVSDISEFVFMKPNLTLRAASCSNLTEASFFHKVRIFLNLA